MKTSKKVKNMLTYNLKTLINFEIIYKLSSTIIFIPIFLGIFNTIVKITGYSYITLENVLGFLTNPLTIIMIFLLLLLMTFYTLLDISTIIIILDCSYHQIKIKTKEAFNIAIKKSLKVFKKKNVLISFMILFLIPFLNIGISSSFISTIAIPEFIMDFIKANSLFNILYICLVIFLGIMLFRWLYIPHYFILENKSFNEARKSSLKLSRKSWLKDFLVLILTQIGIALIYLIFILIGIILIVALYKTFGSVNILGNVSITIIWLLIALSFIIITLLSTPISYACISALYYHHKEQNKEKLLPLKLNEIATSTKKKRFSPLEISIVVLVLICGTIFTYSIRNNLYNFNIEYVRPMEVTAHRGASVSYPENTMAAFKGALELGADWIELDVQQTSDEKIIVLHDTNLKRTTGLNKNTWEATYEEVNALDAGSFFDSKYQGEKIPLLKDVLEFAKDNNIKLNIELKPTGYEKNFEAEVVDLIKEYSLLDKCVITSQVYEVLENVKKYSQDIKTVYVMSLAYGNILDLKEADNFSIEASSITKKLVKEIHNAGKEIYAWTVNTKENMNKMIDLNVDNIITDNINLAKETIYESKTSNIILKYIDFINNLFK